MNRFLFLVLTLCVLANAQTDPAQTEAEPTQPAPGFDESDYENVSPRAVSYALTPVGSSSVNGTVQVNENFEGGTRIIVTLQGINQGQRHALQLFRGSCGPDREPVTPLATVPNIEGDPYSSRTDNPLSFDILSSGDYFLYVYQGADTNSEIAACGEIGAGANASGFGQTPTATTPPSPSPSSPAPASSDTATAPVNTPSPTTPTQDTSIAPEFQSPRTASYYLAPINGSNVEANMQINEIIGGGTRIIVSLSRSAQVGVHSVVIHEADCGPDRPVVERLSNIDDSNGDPYVGITNSTLDFDTLTEGNYFAYVHRGEPSSESVACGEVGVGANQ